MGNEPCHGLITPHHPPHTTMPPKTIKIQPDLHRLLRIKAAETGLSLQQQAEKILLAALKSKP